MSPTVPAEKKERLKMENKRGRRERQIDTKSCPAVACVLPFVDLWQLWLFLYISAYWASDGKALKQKSL